MNVTGNTMAPKKLIALLLFFSTSVCYAHQDFWKIKTFGKIKVRIQTGFDYEEINKAWIIGELANKLALTLKYNDTIFLDFTHFYTADCLPDYFISYDDGSIKQTMSGSETLYFLKNKAIVIREVSRKFNAASTLKMVEYSISNISTIVEKQKSLEYNKNYCYWLINTIDTSLTRKIATSKTSKNVTDALKNRIYRPKDETERYSSVTYYFENEKYHISYSNYKTKDSVLLVLDNVYQFKPVSNIEAIVFDTDSTFYLVQGEYKPYSSKRWTIENKHVFYRPYDIIKVGSNKITFSFSYYSKEVGRQPKERTLVYRTDKAELIQDLDKALNK